MSDEWTLGTLRTHLTTVITALDRQVNERISGQVLAVTVALAAAEKAVNKAQDTADERFRTGNEFRAQQADIIAQTMPRVEIDNRFAQAEANLHEVGRRLAAIEGAKAGVNSAWVYLLMAAGALGAIVTAYFTK